MRTHYALATITLAALLCVAWYVQLATPAPTPAATVVATIATSTTPARENTIAIPVVRDGTVIDAMRDYASSTPGFTFASQTYPSLGLFIESINGRANANGSYWTLYINGTYSELGASSAQVHAGDSIEWKYQQGAE